MRPSGWLEVLDDGSLPQSPAHAGVGIRWACGGAATTMGETSAGASSGPVIKQPQYGFSFTLPADWKQVPLDGSDVTALLNASVS